MGMKDFIIKRIIRLIGQKTNGKKTAVGAALRIMSLIVAWLTGFAQMAYPDMPIDIATPATSASEWLAQGGDIMMAVGLGHKAEKKVKSKVQEKKNGPVASPTEE